MRVFEILSNILLYIIKQRYHLGKIGEGVGGIGEAVRKSHLDNLIIIFFPCTCQVSEKNRAVF